MKRHRGENVTADLRALPDRITGWYEVHARDLPWRTGPKARAAGERPDPYRVWLAEIMLQQTTVPHGRRYFEAFTARWPSVEALAAAADADVMAAWAGLGYYARARNLLKCARDVALRGSFPETASELVRLPGIGPYTAGAIAALAFGQRAAAVDGNVERVFSRVLAIDRPVSEAKGLIRGTVGALVPADRPAEFAEGLMDLGATVCTPTRPDCPSCPVSDLCAARAQGRPERYPVKAAKPARPVRHGHVFVLVGAGQVLLDRRPDKGLLGGMLGLPGSDWQEGEPVQRHGEPAQTDWQGMGEVRHVFTHFALSLQVWRGDLAGPRPDGLWVPARDVQGLPSVFAKALRLALNSKGSN